MEWMKRMKLEFRDNCVDDIKGEIWRQLCLFEDPDYAEEMLLKHSQVEYTRSGNRKKQACQIGFSMRQAREYYLAASGVSLATRPILLYYGAVALSRCCCLLKLGGEVSDDYLRHMGFERHHGLEFVGPSDESAFAESPNSFFEQLSCRVRGTQKDDEGSANGYGNFSAFVRSITAIPFRLEVVEKRWPVSHSEYIANVGVNDTEKAVWHPPIDHILRSYDLLRRLPDMYKVLEHAGIGSALFPGRIGLHKTIAQWGSGMRLQLDYTLSIDHLDSSAREILVSKYVTPNGPFTIKEEWPQSIILHKGYVFTDNIPPDEGLDPIPAILDDARTQKYFSFDESNWLEEPAAYLAILFCLGWLCRYNADLWVKSVKKKAISNVIEAFLDTSDRKLPNLILNQMTTALNHFHT
jgi:hypothetical protein